MTSETPGEPRHDKCPTCGAPTFVADANADGDMHEYVFDSARAGRGQDLREAAQRILDHVGDYYDGEPGNRRVGCSQCCDTALQVGDLDTLRAAVQDVRERVPQSPSPEAIRAAAKMWGDWEQKPELRPRLVRFAEVALRAAYAVDGVGAPPVPTAPDNLEEIAREIHAAWRDGMLAEGRPVAQDRMTWDTLWEKDRELDRYIAARVARLLVGGSAHAAAPAPDIEAIRSDEAVRDAFVECYTLRSIMDSESKFTIAKHLEEWDRTESKLIRAILAVARPALPAPEPQGLDLSAVNLARCTSRDGFNHPLASWSAAEWTNAVAGEAGEACNLAKKLIRHRDGVPGNKKAEDLDQNNLRRRIAEELADAVIYCDLAMASVGYDFATVVRDVFNRKSQELGSPFVLGAALPAAPGPQERPE